MMFGDQQVFNIVAPVTDYTLVRSASSLCTVYVAECE